MPFITGPYCTGALDAAIEVTRIGGGHEWSIAKNKDGADGDAHPFGLKVVKLDEHDDGDAITSCVVTGEAAAQSARRILPPKSGNQRIVWDALCRRLRWMPFSLNWHGVLLRTWVSCG